MLSESEQRCICPHSSSQSLLTIEVSSIDFNKAQSDSAYTELFNEVDCVSLVMPRTRTFLGGQAFSVLDFVFFNSPCISSVLLSCLSHFILCLRLAFLKLLIQHRPLLFLITVIYSGYCN